MNVKHPQNVFYSFPIKNMFYDKWGYCFFYFYVTIWYYDYFNPFYATDLFWYPLKTSENQRFPDVFRGIKRDQWHEMG